MKMPKTPPSWPEIFSSMDNFVEWFAKYSKKIDFEKKYYHWDKLRYLNPPEGLSHEQWWGIIKLLRSGNMFQLPITDKFGNKFSYFPTNWIAEKLHEIDRNLAGSLQVDQPQIVNSANRDRYIISNLFEESITSSQLEGAAVTREIAKDMIRQQRKPRNTYERMIYNNYIAMSEIRKLKDQPLSKELILHLHRLLTSDTLDNPDAVGRFRLPEEPIHVSTPENQILHTPPDATELEIRIERLCDFANGKTPSGFIHPVIRAIVLHFALAYDHPFVDGNGRCARALFYWSMLSNGYWLFEFISISRLIRESPAKYGRAFLYTETDDNDLTYFIDYNINIIIRAISDLHKYIEHKTKEVIETDLLVKKTAMLNYRQKAILSYAIKHPNAIFTLKSHMTSHGIVYESARRDLLGLVNAGLLLKRKSGREYIFQPVPEIRQALDEGKY